MSDVGGGTGGDGKSKHGGGKAKQKPQIPKELIEQLQALKKELGVCVSVLCVWMEL
jgi:hypothetical protein